MPLTDQTTLVSWEACVRSEAHSGGSMGWEGNRRRLPHGADGTNLYSGDGIPYDTHCRRDTEGTVDDGNVLQRHDSSLPARGACVSEHFTAKTVNTFVEIGTTGINIVVPERTATEKAKPQRQ